MKPLPPLGMLRIIVIVVGLLSGAAAQPSVTELFLQRTEARVREYVQAYPGVVGVAFIDLTTGLRYAVHGDVVFPQASMIKIPIMARVFQAAREGRLTLDQTVEFIPSDRVGGSGVLQSRIAAGSLRMPLIDVVTAMIEHSDNSATNKCIALVGLERVNQLLDEQGFGRTRLRRVMMDAGAVERGHENVSTPDEMASMAEMLWRGRLVDEEASRRMIEILKKVKGPMREALPADIESATKTGSVPGVNGQVGVIFLPHRPFVLSVMSTFNPPGRQPVTDVTALVFEAFATLARANEWGHAWRRPAAP